MEFVDRYKIKTDVRFLIYNLSIFPIHIRDKLRKYLIFEFVLYLRRPVSRYNKYEKTVLI